MRVPEIQNGFSLGTSGSTDFSLDIERDDTCGHLPARLRLSPVDLYLIPYFKILSTISVKHCVPYFSQRQFKHMQFYS